MHTGWAGLVCERALSEGPASPVLNPWMIAAAFGDRNQGPFSRDEIGSFHPIMHQGTACYR
jgi:hypothetical protein